MNHDRRPETTRVAWKQMYVSGRSVAVLFPLRAASEARKKAEKSNHGCTRRRGEGARQSGPRTNWVIVAHELASGFNIFITMSSKGRLADKVYVGVTRRSRSTSVFRFSTHFNRARFVEDSCILLLPFIRNGSNGGEFVICLGLCFFKFLISFSFPHILDCCFY